MWGGGGDLASGIGDGKALRERGREGGRGRDAGQGLREW